MAKIHPAIAGHVMEENERLREALDHIGGLSRALRVGGPDPMDLDGLSDALNEAVNTAHAALSQQAEPQPELYTCVGKGGVYELIGRATAAGALKASGQFADGVIVYRDAESNALYCREPGDFRLRMARAAQGGEA